MLYVFAIGVCIGFMLGFITHKVEYGESVTDRDLFHLGDEKNEKLL